MCKLQENMLTGQKSPGFLFFINCYHKSRALRDSCSHSEFRIAIISSKLVLVSLMEKVVHGGFAGANIIYVIATNDMKHNYLDSSLDKKDLLERVIVLFVIIPLYIRYIYMVYSYSSIKLVIVIVILD